MTKLVSVKVGKNAISLDLTLAEAKRHGVKEGAKITPQLAALIARERLMENLAFAPKQIPQRKGNPKPVRRDQSWMRTE
jgi:hypothetical protein